MINKLQYLASASLDRLVILWDTISCRIKRVYEAHWMGVQSLAFNEDNILLLSAGFDHEIFIWNPYIGDKKTKTSDEIEKNKSLFLDKIKSDNEELKLKKNWSAMMVQNMKPIKPQYIMRLSDHFSPIVQLVCVPNSN